MLRRKRLRNIIAIDLRQPRNRSVSTDRLWITHICNSQDLGGTLNLSPHVLARNYELGYLDARKTFGFLDGLHYYLPVGDYQHLLSFLEDGIVPGFEQAAMLYEMLRDRVYMADEFMLALRDCRENAVLQYVSARAY